MATPSPIPVSIAAAFLLGTAATQASVTFTVGTGGTHTSIQAAVNACPAEGCTIQLSDSLYQLSREVWIGSKANLAIEPAKALRDAGIRPRLKFAAGVDPFLLAGTAANPTDPLRPAGWRKWPVDSKSEAGGAKDTLNPYSLYGYMHNGLVVVDSSRSVRLQGLVLDGEKPSYFVNTGVWDGKYDVLFGSVGLNLHVSKNVVVRDCEIRGFFSGVYINGRNHGGVVAPDPMDGQVYTNPGAKPGMTGDHVVETSWIHDNWWAIHDESEWDLGSTFRFNRFTNNRNTSLAEATAASSEANNHAGGMLYVRDVPRAIHRIHNNTIWGNPLVIGHGGYNWGIQHLLYNNIVGGFDLLPANLRAYVNDWRNALSHYSLWLENNLFVVGTADTLYQFQKATSGQSSDSAVCATVAQTAPCWISFDQPVSVNNGIRYSWLWNGWSVRAGAPFVASVNGASYSFPNTQNIEFFPGGGHVDYATGTGTKKFDIRSAGNLWAKSIPWKSTTPGTADYLVPAWDSALVQTTLKGHGRTFSGWATSMDVGAAAASPLDADRVGLKSQLTLGTSRSRCWMVPIRYDASKIASVRAVAVNAWITENLTSSVSTTQPSIDPAAAKVSALSDSTLLDGSSLEVCTDGSTGSGRDIRIQIETRATMKDGSAANLEPAYFLATRATPLFTSVQEKAPVRAIRPLRDGNRLILQGLADGDVHVELRALDGRTLRSGTLTASRGTASLALDGHARGTVLVRVRQGAQLWQGTALLF